MFLPVYVLRAAVAFLCVLAFAEYTILWGRKINASNLSFLSGFLILLGYVAIALGLMSLPEIAERHGNLMMLYTVAIVKFSDVGASVVPDWQIM